MAIRSNIMPMGLTRILLRLTLLPLSGWSTSVASYGDFSGLTSSQYMIFSIHCRKIDMVEELEKVAGLNIPKDFSSEEANKYLVEACAKFDVKCPPPQTTARLLDKVRSLTISLLFHGHFPFSFVVPIYCYLIQGNSTEM